MKKLLLISIVFTLFACTSSGYGKADSTTPLNAEDSFNFLTLPKPTEITILGVTGRLSSRNAEINMAMEDAARKAAMYHSVWASVETVENLGSGYLDYFVSSQTSVFYDQQLEPYKEKLVFDKDRDVWRNADGAVFVRFRYPASFPGILDYGFRRNSDGSPEWITRPPFEIGSFKAGVGTSGRQEKIGDTIRKSYEAAAASIVSYYYTSLTARDAAIGGQNSSQIMRQSQGRLENFIILEIWIDPKSRAVYTLAIARPGD